MQHAVANEALFHAVNLLVDVALPEEHGRYDISIPDLKQVTDGQGPLVLLAIANLDLITNLDGN